MRFFRLWSEMAIKVKWFSKIILRCPKYVWFIFKNLSFLIKNLTNSLSKWVRICSEVTIKHFWYFINISWNQEFRIGNTKYEFWLPFYSSFSSSIIITFLHQNCPWWFGVWKCLIINKIWRFGFDSCFCMDRIWVQTNEFQHLKGVA